MDRRVTSPRRVISPTWGPPHLHVNGPLETVGDVKVLREFTLWIALRWKDMLVIDAEV